MVKVEDIGEIAKYQLIQSGDESINDAYNLIINGADMNDTPNRVAINLALRVITNPDQHYSVGGDIRFKVKYIQDFLNPTDI